MSITRSHAKMQRVMLQVLCRQISQKRYYKKHHVKVRFAPSPTGFLHIGGLRTALYNYLFARANNGTFVLRIEDTDVARVVPGAMEKLHDDLLWAGIIPDEDPIRGGPVGPYMQSKRLDIYKEQVSPLLKNESAYYCFCTAERLDLIRREAMKSQQIPKYDNKCRQYSREQAQEKLNQGEHYCIRFKLSKTVESFDDMIYGNVIHDIASIEGDPVILKSDGYPTYHFANVVDDHLMEISHVLRGVEWQVSTPKHLMLYKAFGWTPPIYGHLPLIINSNGSKLSKRQGDIMVDSYRKQGIFPQALLNYVICAGGGFLTDEDNYYLPNYEDLIKQFDISKIKQRSGKLMPEKLLELNKQELRRLLASEKNDKFLIERVKKIIIEAFPDMKAKENLFFDDEFLITTLRWAQDRISSLSDLVTADFAFLWVPPKSPLDVIEPEYFDAVKVLTLKLAEMDTNDFIKDNIGPMLRQFSMDYYNNINKNVTYNYLMKHLRTILSDLQSGPPIAEMMEMLGKDRTLQRLKRWVVPPTLTIEESKIECEQKTV